jgi:hypothetical protein
MNYEQNYKDYISYVKTLIRKKGDGTYYELHHIIPRSLGGSNEQENLVLLTAREHFLAHYLLYKFNYCRQTLNAFIMMSGRGKYKNSKLYANARIQFSMVIGEWNKGNKKTKEQIEKTASWHRGKKRSKITCENISNALKGKPTWNKGKQGIYSKETLKQISESQSKSKKELWANGYKNEKLKKPSKKIFCLETNTEYNSAKEIVKILGVANVGKIRHCCRKNGKVLVEGKYHFIYRN